MDSSGWLMVDNGGAHALGIKNDNSLRAWGGNGQGQLGLGFGASDEMSPTLVPGGSDWSTVSAGGLHSLGIRSDGSLWSWGYNYYGQLGIGEDLVNKWVPTRVGNWLDWVAVYAGANYSLGIRGDGSLWAWGLNSNGQLGLGDTQERHVPTRVLLPNTMIWLPLILKN
jgi:alpha-tubulin suppressor-like RCC1 family protein